MFNRLVYMILIGLAMIANLCVVRAIDESSIDELLSNLNYAPNEILIKINSSASVYSSVSNKEVIGEENILHIQMKNKNIISNESSTWKRLRINKNADMKTVMRKLRKNGDIIDMQLNYSVQALQTAVVETSTISNQWYLERCSIPQTWDFLEQNGVNRYGIENVTVAVIDTGIDTTHPALSSALWVNADEIAGNGIDDDNNGIVDDTNGANLGDGNNDISDITGHGTSTAGLIAAKNLGYMQGIASNVKIMPCRIFDKAGLAYISYLIRALLYAADNGADVINMSVGAASLDSNSSGLLKDAVDAVADRAIMVASAGNSNDNIGRPNEPVSGYTTDPVYPGVFPNVLGVMSEDEYESTAGYISNFSMWDPNPGNSLEYELMAPGRNIYTTKKGGGYAAYNGTSLSAPIVSGIMALLRSLYPNKVLHPNQDLIIKFLNNCPYKRGKTYGTPAINLYYRSANAFKAVTNSKFIAGNIMIQNSANIAVSHITAGETVTVRQFVSNPTETEKSPVLIAAVYQGNQLKQLKIMNQSILPNQNRQLNESITLDEGLSNPVLRVMLWENIIALNPLAKSSIP